MWHAVGMFCPVLKETGFSLWNTLVQEKAWGSRSVKFLTELVEALSSMTDRKLISYTAYRGIQCSTIGVMGIKRGLDLNELNSYMFHDKMNTMAVLFGVSTSLIKEVVFQNDEGCGYCELLAQQHGVPLDLKLSLDDLERWRWEAMLAWASNALAVIDSSQPAVLATA